MTERVRELKIRELSTFLDPEIPLHLSLHFSVPFKGRISKMLSRRTVARHYSFSLHSDSLVSFPITLVKFLIQDLCVTACSRYIPILSYQICE